MKAKKTFVGGAMLLALLINFPQVSAAEVEVFGEDEDSDDFGPVLIFNDTENLQTENPAPNASDDDNSAVIVVLPDDDEDEDSDENENSNENANDNSDVIIELPRNRSVPPTRNNIDKNSDIIIELPDDEENILPQNENIQPTNEENFLPDEDKNYSPPNRINRTRNYNNSEKNLKKQKARFIKVTADENFIYYIDKQALSWIRMPYSASEYMLDVWVRAVERNSNTSSKYDSNEIEEAREKGFLLDPVDVEVYQQRNFQLKHYYIRQKTKQIQFMGAMEVEGTPKNTFTEREYAYSNWQNLIPGSVETAIYNAAIKAAGKSGASERGHMTFTDMLEEYGRISLR